MISGDAGVHRAQTEAGELRVGAKQLAARNSGRGETTDVHQTEERIRHLLVQRAAKREVAIGELIRLNIPLLTEDRRRDLLKKVKQEIEVAKVNIRNIIITNFCSA